MVGFTVQYELPAVAINVHKMSLPYTTSEKPSTFKLILDLWTEI